jgi:Leucine-rich repeat (LRR) protein
MRLILLIIILVLPTGARPGDPPLPPSLREYPVIESLEQARSNPSAVFRLKLRRAGLKNIPAEIWGFHNLLELDLSHNRIQSISDSLSLLKNLSVLNISFNKIRELPSQTGELHELRQLLAYHNKLQSLPSEIGRLEKLTHLDLWYNEISTLPDSLSRLQQLEELDLRGIIMSQSLKEKVRAWLPQTKVFTSPDCNCIK